MTDKDIELFLTLKYSDMQQVVEAFKKAICIPKGHLVKDADLKLVQQGIKEWVEAGAPRDFIIPKDRVEFFLKIKFGSLKDAYYFWINTPPGVENGLTEDELKMVMDYIPES